jgi:hypothetical protein
MTPMISDTSLFLFAICVGATVDGFVGIFIFPRHLFGLLKKKDPIDLQYREIIRGLVSAFIAMEKVRFANEDDSLASLKETCLSLSSSASEMLPKIDAYIDLTLEVDNARTDWAWMINGFFFKFSGNMLALEYLPVDLNERHEEAGRRLERIASDFGRLVIQNPDTLKHIRN